MDGSRYPAYSQLYGCYFHQDWDLEDSNPDDVVRRYMREESEANRQALPVELQELIESGMSEVELEATLAPWNTFRPKDFEVTIREWLERMLVIAETGDS